MRAFPFPDKVYSREELQRDIVYDKIPESDRVLICDKAWETGVNAAKLTMEKYGNKPIEMIIEECGLSVDRKSIDNVAGNMRYFSEYYSGKNRVYLYTTSIKKWANENDFSLDQAEELILSHEFFHYLEVNEIGETSKQYMVPTLKVGSKTIIKTGVRALSEIGAHGFSRTYYEIHDNTDITDDRSKYVHNEAVDISSFENSVSAEKVHNFIRSAMGIK